MGMYGTNTNSSMYQGNYGILSNQDKGKGKLKEADFEAAFAQAAASLAPAQAETSRIVEVDDGVVKKSKTLQNTTLGGNVDVDDRGEFKQ
jgi:peroxin-5